MKVRSTLSAVGADPQRGAADASDRAREDAKADMTAMRAAIGR
jgi:hypothetical protein